jgi:hypothetical protein
LATTKLLKSKALTDARTALEGLDEGDLRAGSEYFAATGYDTLGSLSNAFPACPSNSSCRRASSIRWALKIPRPNQSACRAAHHELCRRGGSLPEDEFDNLTGSGSVYTTLDLLKYDNASYGTEIPETLAQALNRRDERWTGISLRLRLGCDDTTACLTRDTKAPGCPSSPITQLSRAAPGRYRCNAGL